MISPEKYTRKQKRERDVLLRGDHETKFISNQLNVKHFFSYDIMSPTVKELLWCCLIFLSLRFSVSSNLHPVSKSLYCVFPYLVFFKTDPYTWSQVCTMFMLCFHMSGLKKIRNVRLGQKREIHC